MSGCLNLVPVSYVVRCWGCWAAGGGHRGVVASIADTAIPVTIAIMTTNSKNVINNPVLDLAEITVSPSLFPTRAPSLSPTPSPPGLCSDQPAATSFCHSVRKHWYPESHLGSEPSASPTVYSTLDDDDTPGTVLFRANWSSPFHVVHEAQLLDVQATARLRLPEDVDPRVDWILESGCLSLAGALPLALRFSFKEEIIKGAPHSPKGSAVRAAVNQLCAVPPPLGPHGWESPSARDLGGPG